MSDEGIKMRTVDELFGDDSSDDYDTDEELAKVPTTTTTSRLKKKGAVEKELTEEEKAAKMKRKMEKAADKKRRKEEKAQRKAQRKKEKAAKRAQRTKRVPNKKGLSRGEAGYDSADSYDSGGEGVRTKEDDDFLDLDDDDDELIKEYNQEQNFDDVRGAEKKKGKKRSVGGGGGGGGSKDADNPVMQAMNRMKRQKIQAKTVEKLEEEAEAFVSKMAVAVETDEASNAQGKPGLEKLKMLREVKEMLANKELMRPLLEFNILSLVYRWIQPVKGKLGNVTIRRDLLQAVGKMDGEMGISSGDLKKSNLGRLVMGLYNHASETVEMKKIEKKLIDQWTRPIFRKSGNYRDLENAEFERRNAGFQPKAISANSPAKVEGRASPEGNRGAGVNEVLTKGSRGGKGQTVGSARVSIPFSRGFNYTVRPKNQTDREEATAENVRVAEYMAATRVKSGGTTERLTRIMQEKSKPTVKNQRSQDISVAGRAAKN